MKIINKSDLGGPSEWAFLSGPYSCSHADERMLLHALMDLHKANIRCALHKTKGGVEIWRTMRGMRIEPMDERKEAAS
jgi:hypothetical protein